MSISFRSFLYRGLGFELPHHAGKAFLFRTYHRPELLVDLGRLQQDLAAPGVVSSRPVLAAQAGQVVLAPQDVPDLVEIEAEQGLELTDVHQPGHIFLAVPSGAPHRVPGGNQ